MIRKSIKNSICMLLMFALSLSVKSTVVAAEFPAIDVQERGSITVNLRESAGASDIFGGEFTLYKVGSIDESGEEPGYVYNEAFEGNGMLLGDLRGDGLAEHLANHAMDKKVSGEIKKCEKDGIVVWNELELGLYLVVQTERMEGYYAVEPFLVSIPLANSDHTAWIYDVDASPKVQPSPDHPEDKKLTVKKVWIDNGKNTPDSIKVKLFRDNKEYDSCILNEENNWTKTWDGLSEEYNWTVKEDVVPAGYLVTYRTSGIEITITNTSRTETPGRPPLIQTGQLNWPVPVLAGTGILIFAAGWVMTFMKRKE